MIPLIDRLKTKTLNNTIKREIVLSFPDDNLEIKSPNIVLDSFELESSICDEPEFVFGGCISSQMKIKVINIEAQLNEKRVNVYLKQTCENGLLFPGDWIPRHNIFPKFICEFLEVSLFRGTVFSVSRQDNRSVKEIIAYDDLYKLSKIKAYNYMAGLTLYSPTAYLYEIRDYCLNAIMDDWNRNGAIIGVNDNERLSLEREYFSAVFNENITLYDLLKAYCELNACFCIIDNYGRPKFIMIDSSSTDETIPYYSKLKFEEFETKAIAGIQLYYAKDVCTNITIGANSSGRPEGSEYSWYIINNIILRSCGGYSVFTRYKYLERILWGEILKYRPFESDVYARWWLEPGDRIEIQTGYDDTETVSSFVFNRKIKGINGMHCTISAKGVETLGIKEMGG